MLLQAPKPLFANMFCQSLDPSLYRKVQTFLLRSSFAFTNIYISIYITRSVLLLDESRSIYYVLLMEAMTHKMYTSTNLNGDVWTYVRHSLACSCQEKKHRFPRALNT